MKKNLSYLLFAAVILTGCSDAANQVEAEKVKQVTPEQQDLVVEYKKVIEEGNSQAIFFKYYNDFMKANDYSNRSDELIEQYNIAVDNAFEEPNEDFFLNEAWIDYSIIDDETLKEITSFRDQRLTEIIESMKTAIKNREYEVAKNEYSKAVKDESTEALWHYAINLEDEANGFPRSFLNVSPYYDGVMADEILAHASLSNGSLDEWVEMYNHLRFITGGEKIEKIEAKNPTIGMTTEEAENSSWGKPESINNTTTAYSVREQWVYPNFNYLYFQDGILISFQTSN